MNDTQHNILTIANSGCKINEISIDELLQYYYSTNFIYEAKSKRIAPFVPLIKEHWKKAMEAGEQIIKIITYNSEDHHFASAMLWRYTNTTWIGQHLISTGSRISHIPMLSIHGSLISDPSLYRINHSFIWYRPDNKLPNLFFGGSHDVLGNDHSSLTSWNYYECNRINPYHSRDIHVQKGTSSNYFSFESFVRENMDATWLDSEEFNSEDLELESLNSIYKEVGLERTRTIYMAFQNKEDLPSAVAICNRAPLGMNLSFLENRVVLLFRKQIDRNDVVDLIRALLPQIAKQYNNLTLNYIPLLISEENSAIVEEVFHFPLIKKYNQSICSKEVYPEWYKYVNDLAGKYAAAHPKPASIHY
ncbi:MAG: hypothetical protein ABI761_14740 [Saprospiraceae bacterium]